MKSVGVISVLLNGCLLFVSMSPPLNEVVHGQGFQGFLTHDQIQRDLDSLHSWIQQAHPAPLIHCSEEEYQAAFQQASDMFKGGGSLFAATQAYSRFTTVLKDSHTSISLNEFKERMDAEHGHLPFEVITAENKLVVRKSDDPSVPVGAEILTVNDRPARTGLGMALPMMPQEGNAAVSRLRLAERLWNDFMPLTCEVLSGDSLLITYSMNEVLEDEMLKTSDIHETYVSARSEDFEIPPHTHDSPLNWNQVETTEGCYFVLRIRSFHPENIRQFRKSLNACFQSLQLTQAKRGSDFLGLILDLRGNLGGHIAIVAEILPFFLSEPVRIPHGVQVKSSAFAENQIAHKKRKISLANRGFKGNLNALNKAIIGSPHGTLSFVEFYEPIVPAKKLRYLGPMALLIDGLSASASVSIASWFIRSDRGKTFGEPTMGSISGTFGNPITMELPESHLSIQISTARYFTQNPIRWESNPILPDVPVAWTQSDFLLGIDPAEEAAKQWLLEMNR